MSWTDDSAPLSEATLARLRAESRPIDLAGLLDSRIAVVEYFDEYLDGLDDPALFFHALDHVARIRGVERLAETIAGARISLEKQKSTQIGFAIAARVLQALDPHDGSLRVAA